MRLHDYIKGSHTQGKKLSHVLSSGKLHYSVAVTLYYSENYLPHDWHPKSTPAVSYSVLV